MTTEPVFTPLPEGKFTCVLADPPWQYSADINRKLDDKKLGRSDKHFRCLPTESIRNLPVKSVLAKDAFLFLWTTASFLPDALVVMERWGFAYRSYAPWVKVLSNGEPRMGLGGYWRNCSELILLGRRGKPKVISHKVLGVIHAGVGRLAQKPAQIYDMIESLCEGPRLELFARNSRPGWSSWGNEL